MSDDLLPASVSRLKTANVRRRVPFYRRRWVAVFTIFTLLSGVTLLAIAVTIIGPLRQIAENLNLEDLRKIEKASHIHDRHGDEIGRIYVLNRTPIKIEQVPLHFIHALTSEEDARFYEHKGVDWFGVARAGIINFKAGGETQGASTLTQQLARDAFKLKELEEDGNKHSRYKRKIVEAFLAQRIEKQFSKSDILEMYLNRVYFGSGCYGVEAAAQNYFGKSVSQLSIEESASLCCVLKNPGGLNPRLHRTQHKRWRDHVLDRMCDERFLTSAEAEELKAKPVITTERAPDARLTYVYDEIRQQAMKIIGEEASQVGGFNIYTTVDSQLQKAAEESLKRRLSQVEARSGYDHLTYAQYKVSLEDYRRKLANKQISPDTARPQPEYLQGALLMIDNRDGGILALVGGRDFVDSMYNRAMQAKRTAGTAFVPFIYAAAFQKPEYFPPYQLEDGPISLGRVQINGYQGILGEWGTEQAKTTYALHISARNALAQGRNAATVRLGEQVGLPAIKDLATRCGITSPISDYPGTYLGATDVRLDEMCLAYSTFPNQGRRPKELSLIRRITDSEGKVIYQVKEDDDATVVAMDDMAAYQTHSCLVDALTRGTGSVAYDDYGLKKFPAAGKTGSHYNFKDVWFMGYTSAVTCGVWCGFDQPKAIYEGAFSNQIALPIWADVMNASIKNYPAKDIPPPPEANRVDVCRKSGLLATEGCYESVPDRIHGGTISVRDTYYEYLRRSSSFDQLCDVHSSGGSAPQVTMPVMANDFVLPTLPSSPTVANVQSVHLKGLTVIGTDPYDSEVPVIKAIQMNPDGTEVQTAIKIADPEQQAQTTSSSVKLPPPPSLNIH